MKLRDDAQSQLPFPRKTSTLEDLEPDTEDDMIDVSDFFQKTL